MAPRNLNIFGTGTPGRTRRLSTSSSLMPRKPRKGTVFNAVRLGFYFGILVCTVVCLAIAAHFESILEASELTHFVPLAIFVSVASFLVILSLLAASALRQRNPISTRIELASLGLLFVLWLVLGSYLAASEAAEADVECFSADSSIDDPVELPGFTTDVFHAQYRVLEAFSIFNLILVGLFLPLLGFLALREHRRGYRKVWLYPVPLYPWFDRKTSSAPFTAMPRTRSGRRGKSGDLLPKPVTAKDMGVERKGSTRRPAAADPEKGGAAAAKSENRKSAFWVWVERPRRKYEEARQQHQQQRQQRQAAAASRTAGPSRNAPAPPAKGTAAGNGGASWTRTRAPAVPAVPARPPMRQMSSSRQPLLTRQVTTREYTRNGAEPATSAAQAQAQQTRETTTQPRAVPAAHTRDHRPERATRELERERSERRRPELAPRRTGSGRDAAARR